MNLGGMPLHPRNARSLPGTLTDLTMKNMNQKSLTGPIKEMIRKRKAMICLGGDDITKRVITMTNEELVIRIQNHIDEADNMLQLWQQNTGLIATIAKKYSGYEDFDDLMQEGYIGLCNAVTAYNLEEGARFSTYAAF